MDQDFSQLALIAGLLTNWDGIRLRMEPVTPELERALNALAAKLRAAETPGQIARVLDDLLDLTRSTAAFPYVQELMTRYRVTEMRTLREPSQVVTTAAPPPPAPAAIPEPDLNAGLQLAAAISVESGVATVPIFFATNRTRVPKNEIAFGGDPTGQLSYGLAPVTIPVDRHSIGKIETPHWWTLFPNRDREHRFVTLEDLEILPQPAFAARLASLIETAEAKDLLIFLHGYNVTFEEAARRAAQIAWDMKFPGVVVLYSWPSAGAAMAYAQDEESAFASADSFAAFLKSLGGGPWKRVHVMAHSMGNRVMLVGLADNPRPDLTLGQIVFAAADVYVPLFQDKFPRLQAAGHLMATSYASNSDLALWLSSKLHRRARVGLITGTPFVAPQMDTIDASAVDTGFLGHGYFSEQRSLITDLRLLLHQGLPPKDRGLSRQRDYWMFAR